MRIAAIDARHHLDVQALGNAVADHIAVGKPELRGLAGDELRGTAGALARTDIHVEPDLSVEALLLRDDEAVIRSLIEPVEPHRYLAQIGRARPPGPRDRNRGPRGRKAGGPQKLSSRCRFVSHVLLA